MKLKQLAVSCLIALNLVDVAQATNIIRAAVPVKEAPMVVEDKVWEATDPLYGVWGNTGLVYGCSNWSPLASEVTISTAFTQTATDCQQDQARTVQAREIYRQTGEYRNVGDATVESRTISATAQRSSVGTKETWVETTPTYTGWVTAGDVYGCTNWSPSTDTVDQGLSFTQTATDCKQDQTRYRQNRQQETTTLAYKDNGAPLLEAQTLQDITDTRDAVGTKGSAMSGSYFRIYIDSIGSGGYAQMIEVELLDASGADLFDQHSVVTNESTYYGTTYRADKLVDNMNSSSKWTSVNGGAVGSWVTFKFPVNVSYKTLVIWNYDSTTQSARQPKDFRFQVSHDNGTTWSTVKTFTGATNWLANEKRSFSLTP